MSPMSDRHLRALRFIRRFQAENGFPPSHRELAEVMGMKSTSSAYFLVDQLREHGYIRTTVATARSMVLTEKGMSHA